MRFDPGRINRPAFLGGGEWNLTNFSPITVLLGRNGAGKSLLLRQWRAANREPVHYINPERSGSIVFDPNVYGQLINNQELRSEQNIDNQYRQKSSTSIQRYYTKYAVQDGNVLLGKDELVDLLNLTLAGYEFSLIDKPPFWRGFRSDRNQNIDNSDQLSSGESQILSMTLDILTQYSQFPKETTEFPILLIDEPDAHIHPDTLANFCKFLSVFQARVRMKIVIATHSIDLLGGLALHCLERTAVAVVRPLDMEVKGMPLNGMHAEALSALGGGVIMGRLFGSPLLLVEGDDDHDVWSQASRSGVLDATVVPCGGGERLKKKQKMLEDLFSGLREPSAQPFGLAILDGDKSLPQPNARNPQKYIKYFKLNCHEIENLAITDEVLSKFGITWDEALDRLKDRGKSIRESRRLQSLGSADRQLVDLKGLMPIIENVLFPDAGRWTRIIGNLLAAGRPTGQMEFFLGHSFVEALYGPAHLNLDEAEGTTAESVD